MVASPWSMTTTRLTQVQEKWLGRVTRWQQGGLARDAFAAREGIWSQRLAWWRWNLERIGVTTPVTSSTALSFVRLELAPTHAPPHLEVIASGGRVVRMPVGFDAAREVAVDASAARARARDLTTTITQQTSRKRRCGKLQSDASSMSHEVFRRQQAVVEVGCWAHARRNFLKALEIDRERARRHRLPRRPLRCPRGSQRPHRRRQTPAPRATGAR